MSFPSSSSSRDIHEIKRDNNVLDNFSIAQDLYFSVPARIRELLNAWITETRICTSCGEPYHEIDNIGSWRCKQHPFPTIYVS